MGTALFLALTVLCCGPPGVPESEPAITVTVLEPEPISPGTENTPPIWETAENAPETPEIPRVPKSVPVTPTVEQVIRAAAAQYGVNAERAVRIASCESSLRPWATSPGGHMGLFQWSAATWRWASVQAGYGGASPYDPVASAMTAAWLMGQGGWHHWSCR
jgi:soluble lytic murein transglycosylase-like protein